MTTTTTVYGFVKSADGDTPWGTVFRGDLDSVDSEIARPRLPFNAPTVGATTTCDLSLARRFRFTVSQATTLAFTNVPSSSFWTEVDLEITNGSAFVITWPGSVNWLFGVVPSFQASGVDRVKMQTRDGGTTWYATHVGKNVSVAGSIKQIMGTSSSLAGISGIANGGVSITTTASGAGSPANLKSYVIPANSLVADGDWLRITGWGTCANNVNAKTVRLGIGGVFMATVTLQTSLADPWVLQATIFRNTATSSTAFGWGLDNGTGLKTVSINGPTPTWSGAVTVQFDCTQTSAADVTQFGFQVEYGRVA